MDGLYTIVVNTVAPQRVMSNPQTDVHQITLHVVIIMVTSHDVMSNPQTDARMTSKIVYVHEAILRHARAVMERVDEMPYVLRQTSTIVQIPIILRHAPDQLPTIFARVIIIPENVEVVLREFVRVMPHVVVS